ncbi:MAG TPA: glutamine--fructose-6-phosphate aminotransferase, partial [Dongiaceae bacterium]|nr:glutamine--fructose-6-phosphate aminotransferase [Dongiaceae bacterium]
MCGIVGYVGHRNCLPILVEGLKRLEYRGYDSAGVAVQNGDTLIVRKSVGKVRVLEERLLDRPPSGRSGIAHTRWATHGAPNDVNAHPHGDCAGRLALVHNGIIENYSALK